VQPSVRNRATLHQTGPDSAHICRYRHNSLARFPGSTSRLTTCPRASHVGFIRKMMQITKYRKQSNAQFITPTRSNAVTSDPNENVPLAANAAITPAQNMIADCRSERRISRQTISQGNMTIAPIKNWKNENPCMECFSHRLIKPDAMRLYANATIINGNREGLLVVTRFSLISVRSRGIQGRWTNGSTSAGLVNTKIYIRVPD